MNRMQCSVARMHSSSTIAAATSSPSRNFVGARAADVKVPTKVVILDEIPKGATGQLQRIGLGQKPGLVIRQS
jgi:hypothetical protein